MKSPATSRRRKPENNLNDRLHAIESQLKQMQHSLEKMQQPPGSWPPYAPFFGPVPPLPKHPPAVSSRKPSSFIDDLIMIMEDPRIRKFVRKLTEN